MIENDQKEKHSRRRKLKALRDKRKSTSFERDYSTIEEYKRIKINIKDIGRYEDD